MSIAVYVLAAAPFAVGHHAVGMSVKSATALLGVLVRDGIAVEVT